MDEFLQVPAGITNVPLWEEDCRKIHARAKELIEGKVGVLQSAEALWHLAIRTHAYTDQHFLVYRQICSEIVGLPVGVERQFWAQKSLEREDVKIRALEEYWQPAAIASAHKLVVRYRWALAARQRRRSAGHVD
jgi:hypothetical protein